MNRHNSKGPSGLKSDCERESFEKHIVRNPSHFTLLISEHLKSDSTTHEFHFASNEIEAKVFCFPWVDSRPWMLESLASKWIAICFNFQIFGEWTTQPDLPWIKFPIPFASVSQRT
jgi:hypothetical protein